MKPAERLWGMASLDEQDREEEEEEDDPRIEKLKSYISKHSTAESIAFLTSKEGAGWTLGAAEMIWK